MSKKKKHTEKPKTGLEDFFNNNQSILFAIVIIIYVFWAILLFQLQISIGEDDSAYILAAKKFLQGQSFPTWHGSFYPIFLAFVIKLIGGINLFVFKLLNVILTLTQFIFLYYAFRKRVNSSILILGLLFSASSLPLIIYSSLTYSEPLYMAIQAGMLWAFFSLYDKIKAGLPFKKTVTAWLWLGLSMFLLSITRNIGWAGIITIVLFFLIEKRWREAILGILSMLVFYLPYNLYKISVWHLHQAGFEGQFKAIFLKNPYNPHLGYENFNGFINRFLVNSKQYLSYHLVNILGFSMEHTSTILTVIIYLAFFFTLVVLWRKKRELLFPILYIGIAVAVTFITQQTFWNQERLILIYIPIIVILFASALYESLKNTKYQWITHVFLVLIFLLSFSKTTKYYKNIYKPIKEEILAGNKFAGLTPDWQHFLQVAEYAAKNLPDTVNIACRKPGIAFVNTNGREFLGIYKFPDVHIDTMLAQIKKETTQNNLALFALQLPSNNKQMNKYFAFYPYFQYLRAFINNFSTQKIYALFTPDSSNLDKMKTLATAQQLTYYTDIHGFRSKIVIKNKSDYAVYPDSLMKYFMDRHIDYLILARLRKVPQNKNLGIITTIQRFFNFIELKFPGTFSVVYRAGEMNDEPAFLLKVNYTKHPQLINKITNQKHR